MTKTWSNNVHQSLVAVGLSVLLAAVFQGQLQSILTFSPLRRELNFHNSYLSLQFFQTGLWKNVVNSSCPSFLFWSLPRFLSYKQTDKIYWYGQQNLNISDRLGISFSSEICIYLYLNLIEHKSPCSRMNLNYFLKPFSLFLD